MAKRLFLSNESNTGYHYDEETFNFRFAGESSAHATSAIDVCVAGPMKGTGEIVEFAIGVTRIAVSASGFISATVNAQLRINSVACLSTQPVITGPVASSGVAVRTATNAGGGTSAVVNSASAVFSAGDFISLDYDCKSGGSDTVGATGTGFYAAVKVRYTAA